LGVRAVRRLTRRLDRGQDRVSERLRDLASARRELAALRERSRFSRDLHDTVKQDVFAASMELSTARELVERGERELACHPVAEEALSNVARHSDATRARVRLAEEGGTVTLEVADDGRGIEDGAGGRGVGLDSMRERAESLGGVLQVTGGDGGGTTVTVRCAL